jgi:hypothetical protein
MFPLRAEAVENVQGVAVAVEKIKAVKQQGNRTGLACGQNANAGGIGVSGTGKVNQPGAHPEKAIDIHRIPPWKRITFCIRNIYPKTFLDQQS